jgi:hypothetical protein
LHKTRHRPPFREGVLPLVQGRIEKTEKILR